LSGITIKESTDWDSITNLFNEHRNDPFAYFADTHLFRMFSRLKSFKAFVAEADGQVVGCIYTMRYMYDYGWIGGLLVHKRFRRIGVGSILLKEVLRYLRSGYAYLFVGHDNVAARRLFENVGFNVVYRRLGYRVHVPFGESMCKCDDIDYDVEWDDLTTALGFKERGGVVSIGYYPLKVTRNVFEDLKNKRKIFRCGSVLAIVENSYNVDVDGHTFTFNDYILKGLSISSKDKIFEVNPFYTKPQVADLIKLINHLDADGKVAVWTYQEDRVAKSLPRKGTFAAFVMELCL